MQLQIKGIRIVLEQLDAASLLPGETVSDYKKSFLVVGEYRCTSVYGLTTCQNTLPIASALIGASGGGTGLQDSALVLEANRIVICCSSYVFCLALPTLELLWKTEADLFTCFQIAAHQDRYIVHGELAISMLDRNGNVVWKAGGADIFVNINQGDGFSVTAEGIGITDWNGKHYLFGFDGKLLKK